MRRKTEADWLETLSNDLRLHENRIESDPQSNPIKLLAYDISKSVEERSLAFRDIEALVKAISDKSAVGRARRLHYRAGVAPFEELDAIIENLAIEKSKLGYDAFKFWAESPGQGIVSVSYTHLTLPTIYSV